MDAKRVQTKLFVESPRDLDPELLIPVFHLWIREKALPDLLIDVADYRHVPEGPVVALIGHAVDYVYDLGDGEPGLLFFRKRDFSGDFGARVRDALSRACLAAHALEQTRELSKLGLRFARDRWLLRVPDALRAPDTEAAYAELKQVVGRALQTGSPALEADFERISLRAEPLQALLRPRAPLALEAWAQAV